MNNMYIFVEGVTDSLFVTKLFVEKLSLFGEHYNIIEYANKKHKSINGYINSIGSMPHADYIFISDQDGNKNKKAVRMAEFPSLDQDKIFISIYEIESWIAAGISTNIIEKYKLKSIPTNTSKITKELFDTIIPYKMDKLDFISYVLEDYDLNKAINSNDSFKKLLEYLSKKKQAKDCF